MDFRFYPKESRIFDFFKFPGLIYARERFEETKEEDDLNVPCFVDYLDFLNRVDIKLQPYKKDIGLFYTKDLHGDYDFIDLVSNVNTMIGCKSEKEYLDLLSGMNENDIIKSIAYSIISGNESNMGYSEEILSRSEALCQNRTELISIIKELPAEAASKWNLFLIIEEPVKYMKMYIELMQKILPVFEDFYAQYEEEVRIYGESLIEFLNRNGAKGIEEKTYSILDSKIVNNDENRILISAVMQFAITISCKSRYNYIAWGLRVEEAFRRMKEANENKINERVQIFKNLGDKTRYEVARLIASGETSTKGIARALGVSSATISYHISNLLQSKIIKLDRTENRYSYVVDYKVLDEIINGLKDDLKAPK